MSPSCSFGDRRGGHGIGQRLMESAEEASRLAGSIPKCALYPDGSWCDTTILWKQL
jgi:hypothetical protein